MVCIYCGSSSVVANSRLQRRNNHIWRRRKCADCRSIFTTIEKPELASAFIVTSLADGLRPFSRDQLFVSILKSCEHRPTATNDATALTQIVVSQVLNKQRGGTIRCEDIIDTTSLALRRFDPVAATFYDAYHPAKTPAPPSIKPS